MEAVVATVPQAETVSNMAEAVAVEATAEKVATVLKTETFVHIQVMVEAVADMEHQETAVQVQVPVALLLVAVEMVAAVETASVSSHILNKGLKT